VIALFFGLATAGPASAGDDSETWTFDETTTGADVAWISPTSVNPNAALFLSEYEIILVEVDVTWFGIPFNDIDVTDQVPPELRSGTDSAAGPAPLVLFDSPLEYPGPPDPPCLVAHLLIRLDTNGFGHLDATDIILGECEIDLGFGTVTVQLESVRIAGWITVNALRCPWDLNGSGSVGIADLLALLAAWGIDPGGPPDFDGDGSVGITDLLALLANWGQCPE
jgi:hypothetical protein